MLDKSLVVFSSCGAILFASETLGEYAWIGNLGVVGILCWYLRHTTQVTIPSLNSDNNAAQQKLAQTLTERFTKTLEDERNNRVREIRLITRLMTGSSEETTDP